jgi:hypothetical protein
MVVGSPDLQLNNALHKCSGNTRIAIQNDARGQSRFEPPLPMLFAPRSAGMQIIGISQAPIAFACRHSVARPSGEFALALHGRTQIRR